MKHLEIEKAFIDTVYHGILMLLFAILSVGAQGIATFIVFATLLIFWVCLFFIHSSRLGRLLKDYDSETNDKGNM